MAVNYNYNKFGFMTANSDAKPKTQCVYSLQLT